MKTRLLVTIVPLLALLCAAVLEPHWLSVARVQFAHPDVPASFDGVRIAFLTDIHHGPGFSQARVRHAVDVANCLHPDIVLLGGDYVFVDARFVPGCFQELSRLQAPLGRYGVLGNHDHWNGAVLVSESMVEAGIAWVNNRGEWLEIGQQRIRIGGVDDLWEGSQDLPSALGDARRQDLVILLSHNPDYVERLDTDLVDLVFSGHTHGGQVTLFGKWAPLVPSEYGQKYRTGVVRTERTTVVISNGVGTITPELRLFCRPQIILLELRRAE